MSKYEQLVNSPILVALNRRIFKMSLEHACQIVKHFSTIASLFLTTSLSA